MIITLPAGTTYLPELARLKGQEQRATSDANDAEELHKRASTKTVPTGSIPVLSGDTTISPGDVSVPTGGVLVPTGSLTDSFFDDEPTTRFPVRSCPWIIMNLTSMIGSLMYLTASRPDIMFVVSACSKNQVTPTTSNLEAVKKILNEVDLHCKCKKQTDCSYLLPRKLSILLLLTAVVRYPFIAGSDDYHQILDFLRASHIRYALTNDPIIFDSLVNKFLSRYTSSPADDGGIDDLPIAEIYSGMDNLGYVTEGKLTFNKNKFSPQCRFLVHTILHCFSTKFGSWDQFGSSLAVALIYLSDGRKFNWSSYIFKGMQLPKKLFANMKLNFKGQPMQLLAAMLPQDQEGNTSGGAEDLITLTVVSSVVSTLVQKVNLLETELKDTKKLFKDVVGKLVKKVKAMEVKLKTKKRKVVVSDSDQEEGGEQDVDLDALLALANAAVIVDSNIPPGGASSSHIPTDVPTGVAPAGVSNKGKTPMVEEDITVKERTLKQMEDDRLGEEAAKRLHDEEQAQVDRQRAELNRRRQQEVLASAMYYTEADWINIMAQVEANASLSKTLLGDDVTEDNFPVRMAALIKRKKQALAEKLAKERMERPMTPVQQRTYMRQFVKNQSSALYSTGWTKAKVESFTDAQLKEEFEKIQKALANTQVQAFSRTLKRTGPELEEPSSKQQKSTEAPIPSVPDVPQPPVVSSPKSSGTRRKSLGRNRLTKPKSILKELDLDADDKTFIKVVSDEDSTDEAPILWSALAGWEVISTPLGEINALYRSDQSTKHFTTLREILHMVDRQDLLKLYGMVVTYYENHLVAGAGLMLWGDLQVLMDSQEGGKGSFVWNHQSLWQIRSWRLYTLSNVHVLETVSGEVLYMFADVSYPLSVKLMERMLKHKLEIDKDVVGNDMTTAEQLIRFIKNQIAAAQVSPV
ncbi:hypothetical protein Tco_0268802 [Tanacetum coccineum]